MFPKGLRRGSFLNLDAGKTLCVITAQLGWSDPTNYFGHGNVHKRGAPPAQSGVLSAPKLIVATCATSLASDSSRKPRVNRRVTDGMICVFHAPFTLRRWVRTKEIWGRRTRRPLRG